MFRILVAVLLAPLLVAADIQGLVRFGGLPLPGATVSAVNGSLRHVTITGADGLFRFTALPESSLWTVKVDMQLFAPLSREVTAPAVNTEWDLETLPVEQLGPVTAAPKEFTRTEAVVSKTTKPAQQQQQATQIPAADLADRAADGLTVAGSVNNGASSPFAQLPAFGNNRRGQRGLYNGNLGVILNNSTFDARSFSLTGQATPKPAYSRIQGLVSFGGPIWIPGLTRRTGGPNFSVNYQWTRNSNATTATGLVPTTAQRVTANPQARALLDLYPLPNFDGSTRYNYQVPIVSGQHQDDLQTRITKQIKRNFLSGNFNWQNTRTDTPDMFGFLNLGRVNGINTGATYRRTFNPRTFVNFGATYSSLRTSILPYFANRRNVSGEAGIQGNDQDPVNWGPPSLQFANGISGISLPQAASLRNQTAGLSVDAFMNRGRHNISYGYTHRRQQFNVVAQQDARGTLTFAGPFEDFLNGRATTSSIAFGNADKYLRATTDEAFVNDDFRVNPGLTLNVGLRYEYWSPVTEKYDRLVNFDGTKAVVGATMRPDRNNFAPRVAFSWRPVAASSLVVRGGYGVYYDTSIYQPIAMQMAQQAPLSNSLRVANTPQTPLTLANPFPRVNVSTGNATTFAVDPNFRTGYLHTWQMSLQRDLPAGLQLTATYLGSKGTRGQQQILPNTFPQSSVEPSGYTYLMSNGNSTRHSGQFQLRRRMRSGFTANLSYTWAKAID
ncbi:MAG: TonB-dependent receptor, partial [Acidobacteria bacterium]|nr:TonB-dependent receptor [Acidobacteriota bacterium]